MTPFSAPSRRQTIQAPNFKYEAGEDDPFGIWGNNSSDSIAEKVNDLSIQPPSAGRNIQMPTPENKFLGFCEAAWKLQHGDRKAFKKTNWATSSRFKDYYFFCTCCPYYCRMSEDHLWNKVWTMTPQGLKFRWSFLAKSHVPQKKRAKPSDYSYPCMFCVFLGSEAQSMGLEKLFEHISSVHRFGKLDGEFLARTKCVSDRICQNEEDFDINIWPPMTGEISRFRKDSLVSTGSDSPKQLIAEETIVDC